MDARAYTGRARAYMPLDPTGRGAVAGRMHFGVVMFPTDYAMRVDDLARAVEARGFESLWFPEHTHIPVSRRSPWPGGPTLPKEYWHTHDLFVALATAAAVTTTLKVGSGICLLVERDPITTAKEVASLDFLSRGRVLFGIGGGWNAEEMEDHGTDFKQRWRVLRERVLAMKRIWTEDEAAFEGDFVRFEPLWSWPKPVQKPHPPILLGGHGPRAPARGVGRAGRRRFALPRVGLARDPRGLGRRHRRDRLAAAPADPLGGRAPGRGLPALREGAQPGRVRLRPELGGRRGPRGHCLLSEAAGRGPLHAGHGRALPERAGCGAGRADRDPRRGARGDVRREPSLLGTRQLLPPRRGGGARSARLARPRRLAVPLDEPGLRVLRGLPREPAQQAPQPGAPRAPRARRRRRRDRHLRGRRHPRRALPAHVHALPAHRRAAPLGPAVPGRGLLHAGARAAARAPRVRGRAPGWRGDRRHLQRRQGRHSLRPLLGRRACAPPPPLQRLLLRGHRALHRAPDPALRAGGWGRVQALARLRPDRDREHALAPRPAPRRGGAEVSRAGAARGGARDRLARRAHRAETRPRRSGERQHGPRGEVTALLRTLLLVAVLASAALAGETP